MINSKKPPIYEKGLQELLNKYVGKNLRATTDYKEIINTDVSFICVGTPSNPDGSINLSIVKSASESIGLALRDKNKKDYHVVVVKSTVVPETTEKVVAPIIRKYNNNIGFVMNPEFLREGNAVHDFMNPDRIVIGSTDKKSGDLVEQLYMGLDAPIIRTNPKTAEMVKYTSNSFLATKISFTNEIGNICKELGIDVYEVMKAVGLDFRISPYFLNAGVGYGGSCFPKDVKALIHKAKEIGYNPILLNSVIELNEKQPLRMIKLLERKIGDLTRKKIAILGLAFKNDTDDVRESRSIPVIKALKEKGAIIKAYDPMAIPNMKKELKNYKDIIYCNTAEDALQDADACLVMTEWNEFRYLDKEFLYMKNKVVIDGRKMIDPKKIKDIDYVGLCW